MSATKQKTIEHKHVFVKHGTKSLAQPPRAKQARKTLDARIRELKAERGLVTPMVVRFVDPTELAASGGVVRPETLSAPVGYRDAEAAGLILTERKTS